MLRLPCLVLAAAWLAAPAFADPAPPSTREDHAEAPAPNPAHPLSAEEMGSINGGQEVHVETVATQVLTGSSSGNSITAQTYGSGNVTFSAEALNGFSGIGNFVINTGANNTLQGAINVSVVTVPNP